MLDIFAAFIFRLFALWAFFTGATVNPPQAGNGTPAALMITPQALIDVVNQVRSQNGLRPLNTNAILMSTAQATAETMAASQASGHIGGVKERIAAASYGGGTVIWATENFTIGGASTTAQDVVFNAWADEIHSKPMTNSYYCDVGVGIAQGSAGEVYIILHAAYSSDLPCQRSTPAKGGTPGITPSPTFDYSQLIFAVQTVTPQPDGSRVHTVKQGQSLWAIAIAYGTKIKDIIQLNNLPPDTNTVYIGQKLLIPSAAPPTPSTSAAAPTGFVEATNHLLTVTATPSVPAVSGQTPSPSEMLITQAEARQEGRVPYAFWMAMGILGLLIGLWQVLNHR